ncbi:hypothetical protein NMY22_g17402 [Coprinellus aureogranulatus]|nr:hypothetical protein NMY22_g17402 [Coprinellus aureogranulatus]
MLPPAMVTYTTPSTTLNSILERPFSFGCSAVRDFSYCPTSEESIRDIALQRATGRQIRRTTKDSGEAVWSPITFVPILYLFTETSLRGPEVYASSLTNPDRTFQASVYITPTILFISNHILQRTGLVRTRKQVSSRIQQLKDKTLDVELLSFVAPNAIHGRHAPMSAATTQA